MNRVLVIGGGAAGLVASLFAARAGARVTLLEQNEKLGKKLYITGKGRCNLTNDCDRDEFLAEVSRNARFLYSALDFFGPRDMMRMMENAGCPVTVQRGRRVFPSSEKSSDVIRALTRLIRDEDVQVCLNTRVSSLIRSGNEISGVILSDGKVLPADAVVLATGGLSYPSTGSTGDGFRWAQELGLETVSPSPVLVGLETVEDWPRQLQGLSLRNVRLTLCGSRKPLWEELGELLMTHFGISGPLALTASCHLPPPPQTGRLILDLKPGLTPEQLDARLKREIAANGRKQLRNLLPALLPSSFADLFPELCGLSPDLLCNQMTAAQRDLLVSRLKGLPLTVRAPRPLAEAVVTRGGVSVRELQPGTMACKRFPGLYIAGEMIDVDAHTGGYNLQIAWSTGALAGCSAADYATHQKED